MEDLAKQYAKKHLRVAGRYLQVAGDLLEADNLNEAREIVGSVDAHLLGVKNIIADAMRQIDLPLEELDECAKKSRRRGDNSI